MEILFVLPMGPLPIPQGIPQAALIMGLMGMGNMRTQTQDLDQEIQSMTPGILVIALRVQEVLLGLQIIEDQGLLEVQVLGVTFLHNMVLIQGDMIQKTLTMKTLRYLLLLQEGLNYIFLTSKPKVQKEGSQ